ncbi:MAG: glycosyltransferase [bacterium]|nr:MAG: glycosyltransferase [bacterium]
MEKTSPEQVKDFFSYAAKRREEVRSFLDGIADEREKWIRRSQYYYNKLTELLTFHVPPQQRVCHFGCDTGRFLEAFQPSFGVGICLSERFAEILSERYDGYTFLNDTWEQELDGQTFDYIVVTNPGYLFDIQKALDRLTVLCHHRTRILVANTNYFWEPIFAIAGKLKLRIPQPVQRQNWIPTHVIMDMLLLSGMEMVRWDAHILVPFLIPGISWFINKFFSSVWPLRYFSTTHIVVGRIRKKPPRPVKVSVIVPCKNERGNIAPIAERTVPVGDETELLFVDDCSTDGTGEEVERLITQYPDMNIRCVKGPGVSKGEAVRVGFREATGDILVILDADIAVAPEELPKCVDPVIDGYADFVNTVRFVYPQQFGAMRLANILGNKVFALLFSLVLQQRIGDTLCGTKAFWKKDYENIERYRDFWIWRDRWGDFEQLLGASKLGLKIVDVPVHYMERTYGETKMKNRLENGLLMLKVSLAGLFKLRLR